MLALPVEDVGLDGCHGAVRGKLCVLDLSRKSRGSAGMLLRRIQRTRGRATIFIVGANDALYERISDDVLLGKSHEVDSFNFGHDAASLD